MDAEGAGRAWAAVAARGAPADDGGDDGDGREPVRKRRRFVRLAPMTRLRLSMLPMADNGPRGGARSCRAR